MGVSLYDWIACLQTSGNYPRGGMSGFQCDHRECKRRCRLKKNFSHFFMKLTHCVDHCGIDVNASIDDLRIHFSNSVECEPRGVSAQEFQRAVRQYQLDVLGVLPGRRDTDG